MNVTRIESKILHEILLPAFYQSDLKLNNMSRLVVKPTMWFLNRSDTNRPVQLQKELEA